MERSRNETARHLLLELKVFLSHGQAMEKVMSQQGRGGRGRSQRVLRSLEFILRATGSQSQPGFGI